MKDSRDVMENPSDSEWRRSRNGDSEGSEQLIESTSFGRQAEPSGANQGEQFQEECSATPSDSADSEQRRSRSVESAESGANLNAPAADVAAEAEDAAGRIRELAGTHHSRVPRLVKKPAKPSEGKRVFTPQQRLMLLDTWFRSGLPAKDFGTLVGVSNHTLYKWKKRFEEEGPAGLMDKPKGTPQGSKLSEVTKRAILMLKEAHPEYGCQRISDELARGPALGASATAVRNVLDEAGYELVEVPTRRHPDRPRRFERARSNELWQTDLFSFMLKRQNRRVHLVAFMDDYSRFITGFGLHSTSSSAMVIETFRSAICSYHAPQQILTDNGSQYVTWRGKSAFAKECEKQGIKQVVSSPRHPQTLGKIERFWGTLWRDFISTAVFLDLEDARRRIGLFIDYYNFQRPHQGIEGLVPADRFFEAAEKVLETMKARIDQNARKLAVNGFPTKSVYLTGHVDGKPMSLHRQGEKVMLLEDGRKQEVDLVIEDTRGSEEPEVGKSALDEGLLKVAASLDSSECSENGKEADDETSEAD